ncbi:antitoxin phd [Candidatus Termititenax aidoneus]|uniref:Antitoxin n=1 Tax=Termititenax aidoneus TaxID=2218524 RepID=A0A388TBW5_TERA1|nr:antitoxin phd [Candidatus Termititenax aidoneus]
MNIKPSAAIRKNYNDIAKLCRSTKEPVYLTKNGEGDLVVMDLETYFRRESALKLREDLLSAEEARRGGQPGYSVKAVSALMNKAIQDVLNVKNN